MLDATVENVRDAVGVSPTSRVKNTGTILEKLHRHGGSWLKSIQDIAGMRIVGSFDRAGQDELVDQLVATFADEARAPKVIDRRAGPSHGYRAVHIIVFPDSVPVEIQVRTRLQHEWADMFEKLADRVGRGIRYGQTPVISAEERQELDPIAGEMYDVVLEMRAATVANALAFADIIEAIQVADQVDPQAPELVALRLRAHAAVADLRSDLKNLP